MTPTTRAEAVAHVLYLAERFAGEFCIGEQETRKTAADVEAALRLLGVSEAELRQGWI